MLEPALNPPRRILFAIWAVLALLLVMLFSTPARAEKEFLDPTDAFRFSARIVNDDQGQAIAVRYKIAPEYYMYRDQFKFVADAPHRLGDPLLPPAKIKYDQTFAKDVAYYRGDVLIRIPILTSGAPNEAPSTSPLLFTAISQGCADAGLCYSPQEAKVTLRLTSASGGFFTDDSAYLASTLGSGSLSAIILLFFGLGLLLSFTPCHLPMVPILSSMIVGQSARGPISRTRGFLLALTYTLGMALVYTAMGVGAGLAGEGLAASLQNPWVLGTSAALMVLFALSMFGVYEMQMPSALQGWLSQRARSLRGGRFAGVFAMGSLSALIVGPCMAAPLAGALVYISQTRDTLLGGTALFALALGMGVPLLLIGLSAGAILPRVGRWMESVKRFFGVLLLAVAIYLVAPVIPAAAHMLAWAVLFVLCATFLRVFDRLSEQARGVERLGKGFGVLLLMFGAVLLLGVASGGRDVLQPLAHLRLGATVAGQAGESQAGESQAGEGRVLPTDKPGTAPAPVFQRIRTLAELDQRLVSPGKPVMLDFYADWCVSCKEMERFTFTDERVAARLAEYQLLQVDVTANSPEDKALLRRFQLFGPPGILFFDREGKLIEGVQVIGYQNPQRFLTSLHRTH